MCENMIPTRPSGSKSFGSPLKRGIGLFPCEKRVFVCPVININLFLSLANVAAAAAFPPPPFQIPPPPLSSSKKKHFAFSFQELNEATFSLREKQGSPLSKRGNFHLLLSTRFSNVKVVLYEVV